MDQADMRDGNKSDGEVSQAPYWARKDRLKGGNRLEIVGFPVFDLSFCRAGVKFGGPFLPNFHSEKPGILVEN
jgi:hypothetical protein